ncbi:MAG: T9SS type A sorting domain-containing protein [Bacteroidia bacterium]
MELIYAHTSGKLLKLCLMLFLGVFSTTLNATSYVWNGSVSTSWGEPNNWTPSGIPDLGDDVTISNQTNNPLLEEISGLDNFTMTSGTLDLDAFTLVIYGIANFDGGSINNGNMNIQGSAIFAGTTLNIGIQGTASAFQFNGSIFNNPVTVTFNGSSEASSSGGNTFNSTFSLTNSGSANVILASTNPDTYKAAVTFTNTGSALILASHTALGNEYQDDITFNSTGSSQGIRLGQNGGTSTLSSTKTLNIGGSGFSVGDLRLRSLTVSGTTAQTLTLSSSAALYVESGVSFGGNVTFASPQVFLNGATFSGTSTISKTGSTSNQSLGGNTFTGASTVSNSGSGDLILGVSNPDNFLSTASFSNTGSGTIFVANVASGTLFSNNIDVSSTGSSKGVRFGQSGGTAVLSSGRTISIGAGDFTAGSLRLRGFVQSGATAQTLDVTSGIAQLYLESGTVFNGDITFSFPQVFLNGFTANGAANITKNGAADNSGSGGNTFASTTSLTNSGSGRLRLGNVSPDAFNGQLTLTSSGSSSIQLAYGATGTTLSGNVIINSTGASSGILFGENGGTSTLADTRTISIGGSGFSSGSLSLRGFTQTGSTAQTLTTFSSTTTLICGSGTTFNGAVTFSSPNLQLNGSTFNSTASLTKNGTGGDVSSGGNTFEGNVTIINSGDGELLLANTDPDIFNGQLTVENTGTDVINFAYASIGNEFNENIEVSCTGTGGGIRFGQNSGTSTLASGKTITIGVGGFDSGDLRIANFTQEGTTSQTLTSFSNNVEVYLEENTTFNGNLIVSAPGMYLNGVTFNGTVSVTKSGTGFNLSNGGNVFNGVTTITNTGSGTFILAGSSPDDFNENVTFLQSTAFTLYPAYNINSTFAKNISTVGSATSVVFASNGGRVTLNGTSAQEIQGDAAQKPEFFNLTLNNPSADITLSVPATVSNTLIFTNGKLITTPTNLLTFADNSSVSAVSNNSHVQGPCRKEGDDAFLFPVGKSGFYRPIGISAPSNATDHFTAQFYMATSDGTYTHASKDPTIDHLSQCEYWTLDRTNGSSNVVVTLSWNTTSCGVTNLGDLLVARWNGSMWKDHGNGGTTGNTTAGTLNSNSAISSFSPFTLSSSTSENPLPVNLLSFSATSQNRSVLLEWTTVSETNNEYFSVESSNDAIHFEEIARVPGAFNSNSILKYSEVDRTPYAGVSYYRLKQVDYDGETMFSKIEVVNMPIISESDLVLCPNPVVNVMDVRLDPFLFHAPLIELRDISGKLVNSYQVTEVDVQKPFRIDLNELPQGMYFLNVSEQGYSVSKRLVKK